MEHDEKKHQQCRGSRGCALLVMSTLCLGSHISCLHSGRSMQEVGLGLVLLGVYDQRLPL